MCIYHSEFHYISTDYEFVRLVNVLPDSTVVVYGKKTQGWKLTQYDLQNGAERFGVWCKSLGNADGSAVVNVAGVPCLAMSYGQVRFS